MKANSLLAGAVTVGAMIGMAGCGGSSSSTTPTPSSSGGGITIPGLGNVGGTGSNGSGGTAAAAGTLLTAADVQNISGDPAVTSLGGACTSTTCIYADSTGSGGGGGLITIEAIPGALGQASLQAAIASALSGSAASSGGTTVAVSGLGSGAIKEIDANSATYAFVKDNDLVVVDVSSGTKTGADMDSQVEAVAQTIAGSI
jgi:hypothetical protein